MDNRSIKKLEADLYRCSTCPLYTGKIYGVSAVYFNFL